jgi:3-oxoacyl-[acyl-carrier protein] reductase
MFELHGKTALVTGSSRGIGRGIALGLARAGADVAVNSVNNITPHTIELIEQIRSMGRRSVAVQADVSQAGEVERLFSNVMDEFGRLDILINNAGISREETIFDITVESWHQVIDTNLTSSFLCAKQAMEIMRRQKTGRIIQVTSMAGQQGAIYGHVHYAASKSGQIGLTKTLARTGAPFGITVNAIAPGVIESELLHRLHGEEKVKALTESVPLGLGTVEDVAYAAVFLSSDEARYITGTSIDINGGVYFR